jgi:cytidine deaminase
MRDYDLEALRAAAQKVAAGFWCSGECSAGGVGAALLTDTGALFTGICVDARCSLGFCAEHAAIAEMLKSRQTRIVAIVAVCEDGTILPPCGRCRELIRQVNAENWNTTVVVAENIAVSLGSLLPHSQPAVPPISI